MLMQLTTGSIKTFLFFLLLNPCEMLPIILVLCPTRLSKQSSRRVLHPSLFTEREQTIGVNMFAVL